MEKKKYPAILKVFKIISIVLCCSSLFIGLFLIAIATTIKSFNSVASFETSYYFISNTWLFLLLLPITLGCLVYGIVLTSIKYKSVSNIIVGSIFSFLLLIYGSFTFALKSNFNTSNKIWNELAEILNVDFPEDLKVITEDYSNSTQKGDIYFIQIESVGRFSSNDSLKEFSNSLDDKWTTSYLNNSVPLTFSMQTRSGFDKFLVYSFSDGSYNPTSTSEGECVCIAFSINKKCLYLNKYINKTN